ncbi:MAG: hypothetical protein JWM21_2577 [Acidobacteria bacterium]|nr:hypothetical protein [Acidobacteriota bacterium]
MIPKVLYNACLSEGSGRIHHPSRVARPGTPVRSRFCIAIAFSTSIKLHSVPELTPMAKPLTPYVTIVPHKND